MVAMVEMLVAWGCVVIGVILMSRSRRGSRRLVVARERVAGNGRSGAATSGVSAVVDVLRSRIAAGGGPDDVLSQTLGIPVGVRPGRDLLEGRLSARLGAGEGFPFAGRAAAGLDMALRLSAESGCPLSVCFDALADDLRRMRTAEALRGNALALPRATVGLLAALPLLVLAGGGLLGSRAIGFLVLTSAGRVCLATGGLFYLAGMAWIVMILRAFDAGEGDGSGIDVHGRGFFHGR